MAEELPTEETVSAAETVAPEPTVEVAAPKPAVKTTAKKTTKTDSSTSDWASQGFRSEKAYQKFLKKFT